jgi:hypothetical protein
MTRLRLGSASAAGAPDFKERSVIAQLTLFVGASQQPIGFGALDKAFLLRGVPHDLCARTWRQLQTPHGAD